MASWEKLLWKMVADADPRSYSYDEAARILIRLGFAEPPKTSGSHRRFRIEVADPTAEGGSRGVVIGLVDKGRGNLKPKYITQMIATLAENNLLPQPVED
ncbi:MAG TPA: hypothetical protein VGD02_07665 [Gemmatimonadaceae bacterium]|jgi:hypothetical protein